ncbi:transporter substrate-binding domain-containing protein [Saccharothrix sp. AJ9571]|nr:transporter substrate-binding domain-containing protein [Saccharothrix sp. AJ9571]
MSAVALVAIVVVPALAGCESQTPAMGWTQSTDQTRTLLDRAPVATEEDIAGSPTAQRIRAQGLIAGVSDKTPLLSERNTISNDFQGYDATLAKVLAKYITGDPTAIRFHPIESATREPLIGNRTVDVVIQTYSITPKRAEKVSFAGPYLTSGQGYAVRKGTTLTFADPANPVELNGKKVIVTGKTTGAAMVREKVPGAEILEFPDVSASIQALEAGRGVVHVNDKALLASQASLRSESIEVLKDYRVGDDHYGIGFGLCDLAFQKFVNNFLRKLDESGISREVWEATLGTVLGDPPPFPELETVEGARPQDVPPCPAGTPNP